MERYRSLEHAAAVATALAPLPAPIRDVLRGAHVLTDTDPATVGLHYFRAVGDGRSYDATSHCVYPRHQTHLPRDRRVVTVVLFGADATDPDIILHEFGHVLQHRLHYEQPPPAIRALNTYAARDYGEAFAVAFRAWCNDSRDTDGRLHQNRDELRAVDPRLAAFFDALASTASATLSH